MCGFHNIIYLIYVRCVLIQSFTAQRGVITPLAVPELVRYPRALATLLQTVQNSKLYISCRTAYQRSAAETWSAEDDRSLVSHLIAPNNMRDHPDYVLLQISNNVGLYSTQCYQYSSLLPYINLASSTILIINLIIFI